MQRLVEACVQARLLPPFEPCRTAVRCPLEDADAAYRKGDYATALLLLRPLVNQGNAIKQDSKRCCLPIR
jgi:hypothetical protein